ncbi:MAG TPA: hypothetical protein VN721_17305 [Flavipsychrobacter sp.]|nr:hypothetical protein [Flavipsychrobacter sp.]
MKTALLILSFTLMGIAAIAQTHGKNMHRRHYTKHHKHSYAHHPTSYQKHNIKVAEDAPDAPYKGEHSRQNDGVKKNIARNINYQNNGQQLPPNDGNNSK